MPLLVLALASLGGCYRGTVASGLPPARTAPTYREAWHNGWLLGMVEGNGGVRASEVCPGGWAELTTFIDPLHGLVTLFTLGIYTPHGLTVVCAAEGAPPAPPQDGFDLSIGPAGYPPPPPLVPDP